MDLYNLEDIKPLILFRDPIDQITSRYTRSDKRSEDEKFNTVDIKLLDSRIKEYEIYTKYWSNFIKNKKNGDNYLLINFKDLVSKSEEMIRIILKFFDYEITEEFIKKVVFIHSKENTQELFKKIKNYNITRFTDPQVKIRQKELIKSHLDKELSKRNIITYFDSLSEVAKKN